MYIDVCKVIIFITSNRLEKLKAVIEIIIGAIVGTHGLQQFEKEEGNRRENYIFLTATLI